MKLKCFEISNSIKFVYILIMNDLPPGTRLLNLIIGEKLGHGAFGAIYPAIDANTGILWAVKTESSLSKHKTLQFEYQILSQIQDSPYFPRVGIYATTDNFSYFSMECLGPSLSTINSKFKDKKFSLSTSVRASYHILKCIESFHQFGFIHRDIKPGNILTREGTEHPICLVDFGLSRVYVNPETGQHLKPRFRAGFRGTKPYSSINAHKSEDLSRRDDVISWFYVSYEMIVGPLPWKTMQEKYQLIQEKEKFSTNIQKNPPILELGQIWDHISKLEFTDSPNYTEIYHLLIQILQKNGITDINEPYDWMSILQENRNRIASHLEKVKNGSNKKNLYLNVKDATSSESIDVDLIDHPLISPNISAPAPFSQVSDQDSICCFCNVF